MLDVLVDTGSQKSLEGILCDGTNTNVGWKNGLFVLVERELERQLVLLGCSLHGNELDLRHLFTDLDGAGTTGPDSFGGAIGKATLQCQPVVEFDPLECKNEQIPDEVVRDLSRDQKLLYKYAFAISKDHLEESLVRQKVIAVNHSRWLTLAVRIMILYTRTEMPSDELKTIVIYILQVYAPTWFLIRRENDFTRGPAILHRKMQLVMEQLESVQEGIKPVIQRNGWQAEPGTMLCAMLSSDNQQHRSKAVDLLTKFRNDPKIKSKSNVRI